mmetsp:Transcript_45218/g.113841  ORF Transcript_45218/g.113841 Transcript_45218/m.113841 type:complete len:365 (-) Transcript_45218:117-1211(-)
MGDLFLDHIDSNQQTEQFQPFQPAEGTKLQLISDIRTTQGTEIKSVYKEDRGGVQNIDLTAAVENIVGTKEDVKPEYVTYRFGQNEGDIPRLVVHVTTKDKWDKALQVGKFTTDSLNKHGYIQCYTRQQFPTAIMEQFTNKKKVFLLYVETSKITHCDVKLKEIKNKQYPCIMGFINTDAVKVTREVERPVKNWNIPMCSTPCGRTGLCLYSCVCGPCESYSQRAALLADRGGLEQYLCCAGNFFDEDCCCVPCCRSMPGCCLGTEACLCYCCSVFANRSIIQRAYGIENTGCERCIFYTCFILQICQMVSPIDIPIVCDVICDCPYLCLMACMQAQQRNEMEYQATQQHKNLHTTSPDPMAMT